MRELHITIISRYQFGLSFKLFSCDFETSLQLRITLDACQAHILQNQTISQRDLVSEILHRGNCWIMLKQKYWNVQWKKKLMWKQPGIEEEIKVITEVDGSCHLKEHQRLSSWEFSLEREANRPWNPPLTGAPLEADGVSAWKTRFIEGPFSFLYHCESLLKSGGHDWKDKDGTEGYWERRNYRSFKTYFYEKRITINSTAQLEHRKPDAQQVHNPSQECWQR